LIVDPLDNAVDPPEAQSLFDGIVVGDSRPTGLLHA
jgi:hypothetical protein